MKTQRTLMIIALLASLLLPGCLMLSKESVIDAREDIAYKEYVSALEGLKSEESSFDDFTTSQKSEILLLKAIALHRLERHEEAAFTINVIITKYPDTSFSAQARALQEKWPKPDED